MSTERMVDVKTFVAHARKWEAEQESGWELHVDGVGVTQVDDLSDADAQARDLIETMMELRSSDFAVTVLVGEIVQDRSRTHI